MVKAIWVAFWQTSSNINVSYKLLSRSVKIRGNTWLMIDYQVCESEAQRKPTRIRCYVAVPWGAGGRKSRAPHFLGKPGRLLQRFCVNTPWSRHLGWAGGRFLESRTMPTLTMGHGSIRSWAVRLSRLHFGLALIHPIRNPALSWSPELCKNGGHVGGPLSKTKQWGAE